MTNRFSGALPIRTCIVSHYVIYYKNNLGVCDVIPTRNNRKTKDFKLS